MTMTVVDRALVADDAEWVTGERQERPDPEVPEKARRRAFTAQSVRRSASPNGISAHP